MLKKIALGLWLMLTFIWNASFALYCDCPDISMASKEVVAFKIEKNYGTKVLDRLQKVAQKIFEQSANLDYNHQIWFLSEIQHKLQNKRCQIDGINADYYVLGKKLFYQYLRLSLQKDIEYINKQKFVYSLWF